MLDSGLNRGGGKGQKEGGNLGIVLGMGKENLDQLGRNGLRVRRPVCIKGEAWFVKERTLGGGLS